MSGAVVRPLRANDVPAAQRMSHASLAEVDRTDGLPVEEVTDALVARGQRRVAHLLGSDPDGAWVAEAGGEVVGLGLALRRGPLWFLSLLTVATHLQAQGIGRQLLDACLQTAQDAPAAWILASSDPKALRRYAAAGFALHPGYSARGPMDRSLIPSGLGVRGGDLARDAELVAEVTASLRGVSYGPDLEVMIAAGGQLLVAEDGRERGYAVVRPSGINCLGATTPPLAQRLLWAGLAVNDEASVDWLTADQQWAIEVALAARLPLRPGSSSCLRGALGPLTPYLPHGAYG